MRNLTELQTILAQVHYRDWRLVLEELLDDQGGRTGYCYLQWLFTDAEGTPWTSRKWLLSRHMTNTELVYTAWKAVLAAEEHEAREQFTYRGAPVVGPHLDADSMVEFCQIHAPDAR